MIVLLTYQSVQDIMNMILRLSMDFGFENFHIIPPDKPGTEKDVLQRRQKAISAEVRTPVIRIWIRRLDHSASWATVKENLSGI